MADPKPSNRERIKEIVTSIENNIQELFQSERYFDYLKTMSRFHSYSVNNTILIHMQRPNASLVAGFNQWKNKFGRHVKKGEKGITIIAPTPYKKKIEEMKLDPDTKAPMLDRDGNAIYEEKTVEIPLFRPVKVFDVSQTDGKPLPQLATDLTGNVQQFEVFMEALRRSSPVPMEIKPLPENMDGVFHNDTQSIEIREGMSQVQTICAAVHEITHAKLHNREQARLAAAAGGEEPPKPKDRKTEEVEAESVSYTVCQYYGIDTATNSMGYIATWSSGKDLKELKASLETITKTASGLIQDIDRHFAEICKERGIDLTAQPEQAEPTLDGPDTPEKFAADMVDYMNQLYGMEILDYKFSLSSKEETVAEITDEMRRGYFAGIRDTLAHVCEKTNMPTARDLLERMEKLSDQRDAAMVYHMEANPVTTGDADRFFIQAYEKTERDTLIPHEVVYVGTEADCWELTQKLAEGTITPRRVRELDQETPDSPEKFVLDLFQHMDDLHGSGQIQNPYGSLEPGAVRDHYLSNLRHGSFSSAFTLLHELAGQTDTLTVSELRGRLDNLRSEWEAGFSYEVRPFLPGSSIDRFYLEASRQTDDSFQFSETIFAGSQAACTELKQQLEEKTITVRAVRDLGGEDWPAPEAPAASQPEQAQGLDQALFLIDDTAYLHIQITDTGIDYTFYDKETMRLMDGGQLDYKDPARTPEKPLESACHIICAMEGKHPGRAEPVSLDMLETLQAAEEQAVQGTVAEVTEQHRDRMNELRDHIAAEDDALWETALDEYPRPDPDLTAEDLERCGYLDGDLLPLSRDRAAELIDKDMTVYILQNGENPVMAFDREEIAEQAPSVIFAVPREEWEASQDFRQAVADRMNRQEEREAAFLNHAGDCFAVYQIRDDPSLRDIRFESLDWLKSIGRTVERSSYELVYTAPLAPALDAGAALDALWYQFNNECPPDYQHPSMSVSDIVAIRKDGVLSCHYCDSFGFAEVQKFIQPENYLKSAEMSMEDDFGMIDGIINNGPKERPTVAELEAQVKAGQTISLMDLADAVHREQGRKKSVMARLHEKPPKQEKKRTAPKKSAERDR